MKKEDKFNHAMRVASVIMEVDKKEIINRNGKRVKRDVIDARRMITAGLIRELSVGDELYNTFTYSEIGLRFNINHSTIHYYVKTHDVDVENNRVYAERYQDFLDTMHSLICTKTDIYNKELVENRINTMISVVTQFSIELKSIAKKLEDAK